MSDMSNIIQLRPVKGEGTAAEPYRATVDERQEVASEQWKRARDRHLQVLATANSRGLLRLHNAGRLPGEPGPGVNMTPVMITGLRRELQEIVDLAKDAVDALTTMEQALRGK